MNKKSAMTMAFILFSGIARLNAHTSENVYIAAQALGLGAHIYAGPVAVINSDWKENPGIPFDYKAVTVIRVGSIDKNVDAVSSASPRKIAEELVIYK